MSRAHSVATKSGTCKDLKCELEAAPCGSVSSTGFPKSGSVQGHTTGGTYACSPVSHKHLDLGSSGV